MRCILSLLIFFTFKSHAEEKLLPHFNSQGEIELSEELKSKLSKSRYKNLKPMSKEQFSPDAVDLFKSDKKASPALLFGDFNGDKTTDAGLLLYSPSEIVALAVLIKDQKDLELVEVSRWERNKQGPLESTYLSLLEREKVQFSKKKITPRDLIQVETYLGAVKAFYIFNGKSHSYKGLVP